MNYELINSISLIVIGVGVAALALRSPQIIVNTTAPLVPKPDPVQVKVVMPCDVEVLKQDAGKVRIEHRQPDGTWHLIGETTVDNVSRIAAELAAEGRRLIMPDGTIRENA